MVNYLINILVRELAAKTLNKLANVLQLYEFGLKIKTNYIAILKVNHIYQDNNQTSDKPYVQKPDL